MRLCFTGASLDFDISQKCRLHFPLYSAFKWKCPSFAAVWTQGWRIWVAEWLSKNVENLWPVWPVSSTRDNHCLLEWYALPEPGCKALESRLLRFPKRDVVGEWYRYINGRVCGEKVHGTLGSVDRCSCQCTLAVIGNFCGSAEAAATKSPVCAILGNSHNLVVSFACFTLWYSLSSYSV